MTQSARAAARALAPIFAERAHRWDAERMYCWDNIADLVDAKIMGMTIPTEFGGLGASYLDVVEIVEDIAKVCTLTARVVVEANMGGISAVMAYGTDAPKSVLCTHCAGGGQTRDPVSPNPTLAVPPPKCAPLRANAAIHMSSTGPNTGSQGAVFRNCT